MPTHLISSPHPPLSDALLRAEMDLEAFDPTFQIAQPSEEFDSFMQAFLEHKGPPLFPSPHSLPQICPMNPMIRMMWTTTWQWTWNKVASGCLTCFPSTEALSHASRVGLPLSPQDGLRFRSDHVHIRSAQTHSHRIDLTRT